MSYESHTSALSPARGCSQGRTAAWRPPPRPGAAHRGTRPPAGFPPVPRPRKVGHQQVLAHRRARTSSPPPVSRPRAPNGHMAGHRYASTGRQALRADRGARLPDPCLPGAWQVMPAQRPAPGRARSRRWNKTRARQRDREAAHRRRVRQAQHQAAAEVVGWCLSHRVGTLKIGDPRGVLAVRGGGITSGCGTASPPAPREADPSGPGRVTGSRVPGGF
jgi:hypothetical protein